MSSDECENSVEVGQVTFTATLYRSVVQPLTTKPTKDRQTSDRWGYKKHTFRYDT